MAGSKTNAVVAKARAARRDALAEARALVADIREKKRQIADAFYDIGVALEKLSAPRLYGALGYESFKALASKELELSAATAYRLMSIPDHLTRKCAAGLGQSKALALIELAAATPEPDTAETLARGKTRVRGHAAPIEPGKMSARAIQRAAGTERRSHRKKADGATEATAWAAKAKGRLAALGATLELAEVRRGRTKGFEVVIRCPFDALRGLSKVLSG